MKLSLRACVLATLAFFVSASPALAAPSWGVKLTHKSVWGVTNCPEGAFLTATGFCGVEPFPHVKVGETTAENEATIAQREKTFYSESGGNEYRIVVTNNGSAVPEHAVVTVKDTLGAGLVLAAVEGEAVYSANGWACTVETLQTLTCTIVSSALAPNASYPPISLTRVYVEPGPLHFTETPPFEATTSDKVEVSGGGAPSAASSPAEGETRVERIPFGIYSFSQGEAATSSSEPVTAAGGHPYSVSTEVIFNPVAYAKGQSVLMTAAPGGMRPVGVGPKEVQGELPPGLIGNPEASPELCRLSVFASGSKCPEGSAVGYLDALTSGEPAAANGLQASHGHVALVYNLEPSHGHPAEFGSSVKIGVGKTAPTVPVVLYPKVRSDGDYGLTVGTEASGSLLSADITFCSYGAKLEETESLESVECKAPQSQSKPLLANPTECTSAPMVTLVARPWVEPADVVEETTNLLKPTIVKQEQEALTKQHEEKAAKGESVSESVEEQREKAAEIEKKAERATFEKCSALSYKRTNLEPKVEVAPTGDSSDPTNESSEEPKLLEQISGDVPTGVTIVLKVPQSETRALATPAPNKLTMKLPKGLVLSPSAAEGLVACSAEEFNLHDESEGECPSASGLGTVEVFTPLLPTPTGVGVEAHKPSEGGQLKGELYLGQVNCPNCTKQEIEEGQLLHLYLEVKDPKAGLTVKLEGHSALNSEGQVITTFENLPRLPFSELIVKLRGGQRAPLASSQTCESAEPALITLNPWGEKEASSSSGASTPPGALPFSTSSSNNFSVACSAAAFKPQFEAGTEYPQAGHYSDFLLRFSRHDGEGDLSGLELHTPPGLTAKLAGVPTCGEPQASEGECPQDSEIGTVAVSAGSGTKPFIQTGQVYLTGPYNGSEAKGEGSCTANGAPECAPYGLSIVVPTQAGPFKLAGNTGKGKEVTRAKIEVNESTAAVNVKSNPLPSELDGVQLRIKEVQIDVNRKDFYLNPTNCEKTSISADITAENQGIEPAVSERAEGSSSFDVGGCRGLSFKPTLTAYTKSNTSKAGGASLNVKLSQRSGEANIHKVELQLPIALPSRLETLNHACSEKQFAEDPWKCPAAAFVGGATAHTPLLSVPLTGRAVLVSHAGAAFPDVDFLLFGQGISIHLVGHTNIKNGITYSKFETVPDQPITSFEANLPIGPHSILAANGYLCTQNLKMPTTITAQNGAVLTQKTQITVRGCPPKKARIATVTGETSTTAPWHAGDSPSGLTGSLTTNASQSATVARPAVSGNCKNESSRAESDWNEAIVAPYSEGLPECRAYEMVSPVEKQGQNILDGGKAGNTKRIEEGFPVSPSGESVGFVSEGAFADPNNWAFEQFYVRNPYIARRSVKGWETSSAYAPPTLVEEPESNGLSSDFSEDLAGEQASCGEPRGGGYTCAFRRQGGSWEKGSGPYRDLTGKALRGLGEDYKGGSEHLSRLFIQPNGTDLSAEDSLTGNGIYELSGVGGSPAAPRLVNVAENKQELKGQGAVRPRLGGIATDYHAISKSGERAFFTAESPVSHKETIFAREDGTTTYELSAPEPGCTTECEPTADAEYQGASANGEKVFFTTEQKLLKGQTDTSVKLYEYDFSKPEGERLSELSHGSSQDAQVQGVVSTSPEGSHVYFVAQGVLTSTPDTSIGQTAEAGSENLYGVNTLSGEVKFIGKLSAEDQGRLWVQQPNTLEEKVVREVTIPAQTTPNGSYLAFSTYAHLVTSDTNEAQAAYLYDFNTGQVTWLSHMAGSTPGVQSANEHTPGEGDSAVIAPLPVHVLGAYADIDDWNRAISGEGASEGQYVIFTTSEKLQSDDINGAPDVYLWHAGTVSLISDGHATNGVDLGESDETRWPAMSASGKDIFFMTSSALTPEDSDELQDLYDARVEGGLEQAKEAATCSGEACLEGAKSLSVFGPIGSTAFTAGQNFLPPTTSTGSTAKSASSRR
jgi:hypothetical protein